jgi:RsiW-degrading membrane proteinase PrsW (M82 family)
LLVSLVLAAVVGFLLSYFVQLALIPLGAIPLIVVFAPLTEEPFKAVGMLIVAFFMWKVIPNRRYGAALGAAAGLGFAIAEDILYFSQFSATGAGAEAYVVRFLLLPFMHPTWSAFVGIGVFVFVAERSKTGKVKWGLPLMFLSLGMLNHMVWNSIASLGIGYGSILVDVFVTFPMFALILRDFLEGHFNFQNFLEPVPDTAQQFFPVGPPPPPPPPT